MVLQPFSAAGASPPVDARKPALIKAPLAGETAGTQDPEVLRMALSDVTVQLARALRSRDEILQNVSHEFRSPLTLIIGYAETLSGEYWGELTKEQAKAAEVILEQGRRLQSMVERMLKLQMVDNGTIDKIPVPLDALIETVVEKWQPQIEHAGGAVALETAGSLPLIMGDPAMLHQAFDDLLDNAVKYGLEAGCRSRARSAPPSGNATGGRPSSLIRLRVWARDGYVHIAITDQGIGISKDEIDQIFDRFYQVDRGLTRSDDGVGIGLALVKSIVHAHDGVVRVTSRGINQGSTFTVSLPAVIGSNAPAERPLPAAQHLPS
ncbi:MAG: HAMP domain-containing sensor histidine kinase [Caldilineales bacterium]